MMCGAPFSTKGLQAQAAGTDKGRLNKSPGQYQTGGLVLNISSFTLGALMSMVQILRASLMDFFRGKNMVNHPIL